MKLLLVQDGADPLVYVATHHKQHDNHLLSSQVVYSHHDRLNYTKKKLNNFMKSFMRLTLKSVGFGPTNFGELESPIITKQISSIEIFNLFKQFKKLFRINW